MGRQKCLPFSAPSNINGNTTQPTIVKRIRSPFFVPKIGTDPERMLPMAMHTYPLDRLHSSQKYLDKKCPQ